MDSRTSRWKIYVANRVSEIQTMVPEAVWHHMPGRENPADCASQGLSPSDLVTHQLWWHGPPWFWAKSWPSSPARMHELPEKRTLIHVTISTRPFPEESELRFSSLHRLLRVT